MIFLSTGGHRFQTAMQTALDFYEHGVNGVELSGGAFSKTCHQDLLALPRELSLQVHNYFPPPEVPFVLNLASNSNEVVEKSMSHVMGAIRLSVSLGRPSYSFHAGFRINPKVNELGADIARHNLIDRSLALKLFGERVTLIAEEARKLGVTLLIENNVVNLKNLSTYGEDPFLLTHPDEIASFMEQMPSNVNLLLDVAHLKVSATSLKFDLLKAHESLKTWIKGYHLSDNDGTEDSNQSINSNSWFWKLLIPDLNYYSLEVYRLPNNLLADQYRYFGQKLSEIKKNGVNIGA